MKVFIVSAIILFAIVIKDKAYSAENTEFSYQLELYNFMIKNHDTNCEIITDNKTKNFKENSKYKFQKIIKKNFKNNFNLKCDNSLDLIVITIYNRDIAVERIEKRGRSFINYNLEYFYMDFEITGDNLTCETTCDNEVDIININNKKDIKQTFYKKFKIECDNNFNNAEMIIYNKSNKKIFYDKVVEATKFRYNKDTSITKDYNIEIYIKDNFSKDNICKYYLDNEDPISITYNKDTKLKDKRAIFKGGNSFKMKCQNSLEKILLFIVEREWSTILAKKEYHNTQGIAISFNELLIMNETPLINKSFDNTTKVTKQKKEIKKEKPKIKQKVVTKVNKTKTEEVVKQKPIKVIPWYKKLWKLLWG